MPVGSIAVTEGSGKNLHTWQRSVSAVNREEQYGQLAEPGLPTFTAVAAAISTATVNDHILTLNAAASIYGRVYRITIRQSANATAAAIATFGIYRIVLSLAFFVYLFS